MLRKNHSELEWNSELVSLLNNMKEGEQMSPFYSKKPRHTEVDPCAKKYKVEIQVQVL